MLETHFQTVCDLMQLCTLVLRLNVLGQRLFVPQETLDMGVMARQKYLGVTIDTHNRKWGPSALTISPILCELYGTPVWCHQVKILQMKSVLLKA